MLTKFLFNTDVTPRFTARSRALRTAVGCAAAAMLSSAAAASSHREAPGITLMPKVDATDFYLFNSYEVGREGFVTIIANYQPFQTEYGGPNFFQMDPDALYQIHIDNNGDAREDITFTFRFNNQLRGATLPIGDATVASPLYNLNRIGPFAFQNSALNIIETFTLDVTFGDQYTGATTRSQNIDGGPSSDRTLFRKPADFVGAKSFVNYEAYARRHIARFSLPGARSPGRVFVGQRKDPFVVNLGEAFDLVNLNPLGAPDAKPDSLAENNCTSIIIEVPANFLRQGQGPIIGGWTTASLPATRTLSTSPTFQAPSTSSGDFIQVSRLANPLVNELVIGLPDKNRFNNSRPRDDAQFATYVTNPTLPAILEILFPVTAPCLPRNDLVAIFLTGVSGLNQRANPTAAEIMRLNTDLTAIPIRRKGQQNTLGVLGGDNQGYPNGRRPGDDVVDISLRAVMGAIIPDAGQPGGCAPSGALAFTDQAAISDQLFDDAFPYIRTPVSGSPAD